MLKHGILGLLNYGDMTGYEIRETFKTSLNFFWTAQSSQIYRELHTLQRNGWIEMTTIPQAGKPDKNLCSITENGRMEFLRWLNEEGTGVDMRTPLLMRVFFFGERSCEENITYFRRLAAECQKYKDSLDSIEGIISTYEKQLNSPNRAVYWQMTVNFGRRTLQTYIDWASDCIQSLEGKK